MLSDKIVTNLKGSSHKDWHYNKSRAYMIVVIRDCQKQNDPIQCITHVPVAHLFLY